MSAPEAVKRGLAVRDANRIANPLRSPIPRESHSISANIGKRRALAGPLLSSPARKGHGTRMAEMYSNARAHLDSLSDVSASPRRYQPTQPSTTKSDEIKYPTLPVDAGPPRNLENETATHKPKESSELDLPVWIHDSAIGSPHRGRRLSRDAENHSVKTPPLRLNPRPIRRDVPYSAETLKPKRYYASLGRPVEPPQSDTALSEALSGSEGSSASWTGDSEFYYPKPQPLPQQLRQCSVSEWLERLPEKLDSATDTGEVPEEEAEDDEDELAIPPLSPYVELQRGTVRRRRRVARQVRQRCASYDDEDIFGRID
ncbi:hypothetical protein BLS_004602 [Venturia inaequalis]|nr:hypothetical protein BLS_004602 [Venturia inaequalis]RDI80214.1 hypothetical protein Vi05172_g9792 [Venturia inaequalis]